MPDFNAQNTDAENAKATPKSVVRDNDLRVNGKGGLQDVARQDPRDQREGGSAVTAEIR